MDDLMKARDFLDFCSGRSLAPEVRDAFLIFLQSKYPDGIPDYVNLSKEYAEFYRESTSRAE